MSKVTTSIRCICTLVAGMALLHATVARAETLESAEKSIADAWEKSTSATYDMESLTDTAGQGYSMKMAMTAKCEMSREGGKYKMHMDSESNNEQNIGGNTTKTASKSSMVVDGEYAYMLTDNAGQKMAMKMSGAAYSINAGGAGLFKTMAETNDVSLQPDETVDGQAAHVIDAKDKKAGSTMRYYFSKDTGWVIQMISKGPDGKVLSTTKLKNIKLGATIPADHFVFTPPAGVTVTDMSNMGKK